KGCSFSALVLKFVILRVLENIHILNRNVFGILAYSCLSLHVSGLQVHRQVQALPLAVVVDIMRVNVDKVLERDQKLSELDDRADALQAGASQFETSAAKLKRKYWWKNCKGGSSVGGDIQNCREVLGRKVPP
ncbi:VAMP3, partial [Cervus elaphus hippelaphus]